MLVGESNKVKYTCQNTIQFAEAIKRDLDRVKDLFTKTKRRRQYESDE